MSGWQDDDPSPVEDLASDVTFGGWLESLEPETVLADLESRFRGQEKATLYYVRRKLHSNRLAVSQLDAQQPESPDEGQSEKEKK